jgi:hypothetical protein
MHDSLRTIPFRTIPRTHSTSRVANDTNSHMRVHTYEFMCDQSIIRFRTYDLVLLLFITFWKNVLLTSAWILGPAYTFVHHWLIMANLILPNTLLRCLEKSSDLSFPSHRLPSRNRILAFAFRVRVLLRVLIFDWTVHKLRLNYSKRRALQRLGHNIAHISSAGQSNTLISPSSTLSLMKKNFALMCFVFFPLDIFPLLMSRCVLMLS